MILENVNVFRIFSESKKKLPHGGKCGIDVAAWSRFWQSLATSATIRMSLHVNGYILFLSGILCVAGGYCDNAGNGDNLIMIWSKDAQIT